jgi:hypothetical protein
MPFGPPKRPRVRPVLDTLEDLLPVNNLLSLTPAFQDSGLLSPGKGSAAASVERSLAVVDLKAVFDDSSPLSPPGLAALAGVDQLSAAGSSTPSFGHLARDETAASVSPAPPAPVPGPPTNTGALPASAAYLTALAAGPARPTAATGMAAAPAAQATSPSGQEASLASALRSAPAIGSGSPALQATPIQSPSSPVPSTKTSGKGYTYYRYGSQTDVTATSTPGVGLEGGGTDIDAFYQWMGSRAGGGDFLVLAPVVRPCCNSCALSVARRLHGPSLHDPGCRLSPSVGAHPTCRPRDYLLILTGLCGVPQRHGGTATGRYTPPLPSRQHPAARQLSG